MSFSMFDEVFYPAMATINLPRGNVGQERVRKIFETDIPRVAMKAFGNKSLGYEPKSTPEMFSALLYTPALTSADAEVILEHLTVELGRCFEEHGLAKPTVDLTLHTSSCDVWYMFAASALDDASEGALKRLGLYIVRLAADSMRSETDDKRTELVHAPRTGKLQARIVFKDVPALGVGDAMSRTTHDISSQITTLGYRVTEAIHSWRPSGHYDGLLKSL